MGRLSTDPYENSPQETLANLINVYISSDRIMRGGDVRRMFVKHWSRIRLSAHQLHDQIVSDASEKVEIEERRELARLKDKYECECK